MNTFFAKILAAFCAAMTLAPAAIAKDAQGKVLDAEAAKSLISGRMWQAPIIGGPGHYYWSWKSDGSVCLRQNETTGKCLDTGTWKLKGNRLCYELTWYGAGLGLKSRCLRIVDEGNGRYRELEESGLATLKFSVVK